MPLENDGDNEGQHDDNEGGLTDELKGLDELNARIEGLVLQRLPAVAVHDIRAMVGTDVLAAYKDPSNRSL